MSPEVLEAWARYLLHCEEMGKKLSTPAVKMALVKVFEIANGNASMAEALINQSVESGWVQIYPLTAHNMERYRARERDKKKFATFKCEYCDTQITENARYDHEENVCPNFKKADPQQVADAVKQLTEKWKAN